MSRVGLKQMIGQVGRRRGRWSTPLTRRSAAAWPSRTRDGRVLHGDARATATASASPCRTTGHRLGWVTGPAHGAGASRRCSITWSAREVERKALGAEVLHLYREINLIYSFSEKLAALLDVERVAQLTLQEARHLIVATDGVIMLLDEDSGELTPVAGFGDEMPVLPGFRARPRHHRRRSPRAVSARSSTTCEPTRGASRDDTTSSALIVRAAARSASG